MIEGQLHRVWQHPETWVLIAGVVVVVLLVLRWWWRRHILRGFQLLELVGERRPVEGRDIQVAFDVDLRRHRDEVLAALQEGEP